jgi:hypothetical protein
MRNLYVVVMQAFAGSFLSKEKNLYSTTMSNFKSKLLNVLECMKSVDVTHIILNHSAAVKRNLLQHHLDQFYLYIHIIFLRRRRL